MLFVASVLLPALTPVKLLTGQAARRACSATGALCAEAILNANEGRSKAILSNALARDLSNRMGQEAALVVAEDEDDGELIGCCAIEVGKYSPAALTRDRVGQAAEDILSRPLLSSLAVRPGYRRKGLGKRMVREVEAWAKDEGFDEVLLKVERSNGKARNLYRNLGYRIVAVDKEAERPEAGKNGLTFVPTTQVAMRKDLRYPPLDSVAFAAASTAAVIYVSAVYQTPLAEAASLAGAGELAEAARVVLALLPANALSF